MSQNGSQSDGTLNIQTHGTSDSWLAQGIASAAITSAINLIIGRLCTDNYRDLSANAASLNNELEEVLLLLNDMKKILNDNTFKRAMRDDELTQLANILARLERKSDKVQSSLTPFLPQLILPKSYRPMSNATKPVTDPSPYTAAVCTTVKRISQAFHSRTRILSEISVPIRRPCERSLPNCSYAIDVN